MDEQKNNQIAHLPCVEGVPTALSGQQGVSSDMMRLELLRQSCIKDYNKCQEIEELLRDGDDEWYRKHGYDTRCTDD